jgi:hypothetical protein
MSERKTIRVLGSGGDYEDWPADEVAKSSFAAPAGSASVSRAQARMNAIKEIQYLCEEALDHETSWPMFCELVRRRLETETALMPN